MLYLWKLPECPNKHIAVYDRDLSNNYLMFTDGIYLEPAKVTKPTILHLEVTKAEISKYDAMPSNASSPLVNQKIVDMLEALAPEEVQFFDAEVRCKDGCLNNYKLLNFTRNFIGIDHEKSVYSRPPKLNIIMSVRYLVYKPGCMGDYKMARDAELLGHIVVTEEIKHAFKEAKLKGPNLISIEDYCKAIWSR